MTLTIGYVQQHIVSLKVQTVSYNSHQDKVLKWKVMQKCKVVACSESVPKNAKQNVTLWEN